MKSYPPDYRIKRAPADDRATAPSQNDQVFTIKDGRVDVDFSLVQSLGIRNMTEVASYAINTILGSRSHVVRFINGGLLQFAYNHEGHLIEFRIDKLAMSLNKYNQILISIPEVDGSSTGTKISGRSL